MVFLMAKGPPTSPMSTRLRFGCWRRWTPCVLFGANEPAWVFVGTRAP